ncbi:Rho guanine nucleotide exchange factor [Marasmius crinis-equi]|uniref:Rho guanine nucleotide exchange factor n=1 Tax=Marasmius crinis-equi TaxID=585013 RepID=A0ABR3EQK3_9AGAR
MMWNLMEVCWHATPSSRPDARQVVDRIVEMDSRKTVYPAPDWNESLFTQVWKNVEYRSLVTRTSETQSDDEPTLTLPTSEDGSSSPPNFRIEDTPSAETGSSRPRKTLDGISRSSTPSSDPMDREDSRLSTPTPIPTPASPHLYYADPYLESLPNIQTLFLPGTVRDAIARIISQEGDISGFFNEHVEGEKDMWEQFNLKRIASQELVATQIPEPGIKERTPETMLLDELVEANEELIAVLRKLRSGVGIRGQ